MWQMVEQNTKRIIFSLLPFSPRCFSCCFRLKKRMSNLDGCSWAERLVILNPFTFQSSHWDASLSLRLHLPPKKKILVEISERLLRIFCFGKPIITLFLLSNSSHTVLTPNKFLSFYIVKCTSQSISLIYIWWKKQQLFHWQFKVLNKMTLFLKQ